MSASLLQSDVFHDQLQSLTALVEQLRQEVSELRAENAVLRQENAELRQQVSELKCEVGYWKSRHADAVKKNVKLQAELDQAKAEIRQLKAERFGKKSEKQSLVNGKDGLAASETPPTKSKKRGQQPGRPAPRRRDLLHLPACDETIDIPDTAKVCACCGLPMADLGCTNDSQQIEMETEIYRRVLKRKRYRRTCNCKQQPRTLTAPLPPKLLPKSLYGTSIWTHLLLEKFHLQRPTHRTIEQFRLLGLRLAPGTIADGFQRIEPLVAPIYEAIRAHHVQSGFYHADETRWSVFAEKAGKIGHRWWLWLFAGKDSVMFVLDPSRSHEVPQSHFPQDAQGVLIVDRYSAYKAMQQVKNGKLLLAFCWAHVRRDFIQVGKGFPELKDWALAWLGRIHKLYRLNRERLRHASGSCEFAAADFLLRQHIEAMAADRDCELNNNQLRQPCRKALVSLKEHWSGLTLFVDDPRIPMDNNYGERLIRNPAVGRKNYYGSGAEWAGRLATIMFSIFATLVIWKINPKAWLTWYLNACAENAGQAPNDPTAYLPWNLSEQRLAELRNPHCESFSNTS
jgi:transposase